MRILALLAVLAGAGPILLQPGGGGAGVTDGDKTDITVSGDTWSIDNDVVTNAKSANMAVNTVKCRITTGTGDPEDCTAANVRTIISAVSGSATAYLDGTGSFSTPAGGSSALWSKHYAADMLLPVTATGWPVTSYASNGTSNLAGYKIFTNANGTDKGVGFEVVVPDTATTITLDVDGAAAASGFTTNNGLQWELSCRAKGSSASFVTVDHAQVTLTDSAAKQRKTLTFTVSDFSAAGADTDVWLCELTRDPDDSDDTLSQAFWLFDLLIEVE